MREPLCDQAPDELDIPMTQASDEMLQSIISGDADFNSIEELVVPGAEGRIKAIAQRLLQERS